jgi:hypothetical protein
MTTPDLSCWTRPVYLFRRKVLKLVGGAFHIWDGDEAALLFYGEQKGFRLKEDVRLYSDETKAEERLRIHARSVLDFGATYDVIDPVTEQSVGALRRRPFKSMLKDQWWILGPDDSEVGSIDERGAGLALLRRLSGLFSLIVPQQYDLSVGGRPAGRFLQNRNPFVYRLALDFRDDVEGRLDRRLGIAAAVLLGMIEGKQDSS